MVLKFMRNEMLQKIRNLGQLPNLRECREVGANHKVNNDLFHTSNLRKTPA